jgi:hypothetical protein
MGASSAVSYFALLVFFSIAWLGFEAFYILLGETVTHFAYIFGWPTFISAFCAQQFLFA